MLNNPLIPGDPYSYDLKWLVAKVKEILAQLGTLDEAIEAKIFEGFLEHSVVQFKTVAEMLAADITDGSIVLTLGYHAAGDLGGAFYLVQDFNPDQCALNYFLTMDNNSQIAVPLFTEPYVTAEQFGVYGDGVTDDTDLINQALTLADRQIIFNKRYRVIVPQLNSAAINIPEGVHMTINGEIFIDGNGYLQYGVLKTTGNNVTIDGNGTVRGDKYTHTGTSGEWGNVLVIDSCDNVKVKGVTFTGGWGDGIYIRKAHHIDVAEVTATDNRRNGCSIISGGNIALHDSKFTRSNGIAPQGGVDVEPNADDNELYAISVIDCDCTDNYGVSFGCGNSYVDNADILFSNIVANSVGVRNSGENSVITVSNCTLKLNIDYYPVTASNEKRSSVLTFENVLVDFNGRSVSGAIYYPAEKAYNIRFNGCTFKNGTVERFGFWPVQPAVRAGGYNTFQNCLIDMTCTNGYCPVPALGLTVPPYGASRFDGTILNYEEMVLTSSNNIKATTGVLTVTGTNGGNYSISVNLSDRGTAPVWVINNSGVQIIVRGSNVGGIVGGDVTLENGEKAYFTPISEIAHYTAVKYS